MSDKQCDFGPHPDGEPTDLEFDFKGKRGSTVRAVCRYHMKLVLQAMGRGETMTVTRRQAR